MYYRKHSRAELTLTRLSAIRKSSITQDCVGERMCVCVHDMEGNTKKEIPRNEIGATTVKAGDDGCMIWRLYLVYAIADDDDDDGWQQHCTT